MNYLWIALILPSLSVASNCIADSCLLALRPTSNITGRHSATQDFCSKYLQDSSTTLPEEALAACQDKNNVLDKARVASACACEAVVIKTTPTTGNPAYTTSPPETVVGDVAEPCALVSSSSSAQKVATPSAEPTVSAQLAFDCLNSVPLNKTAAIQLVDAIGPYLEWQSDLVWKKDPPADYDFPAHDVIASLAMIRDNLVSNRYVNEYEFQGDLYQVFAQGHDGHFVFYPDAIAKAFEFGRQRSLVSISEDGRSLPVIKLFEDVIYSPESASIVTKINDIDASTYIFNFSTTAPLQQDADAVYNSMFYEKASYAASGGKGYFSGGGRTRYIYPGPFTKFTFANGSSLTLENTAKIKGNFYNVADGQQFYSRFCSVSANSFQAEDQTDYMSSRPVLAPGYPPPVITTNDTILSGYYMDGQGYEDVAVLSVLAFESRSISEFQEVAQKFMIDAKRDGKTKIVIDLSYNGGGYILQGYDLFRQFFPTIEQEGNSRWRAGKGFTAIAEIFSAISKEFDPATASDMQINEALSWFNYRYDLNLQNAPFRNFEEKFGPYTTKGDNFTNDMRWNLNDPLTTSNSTYGVGIEITGYGSRKNLTQYFDAKNIIMLYDGYCASTCTIFSEFMRTQAGVKSIAMGGRPKEGLIQGVGGVKGSQVLSWNAIYSYAQEALPNATIAQAKSLGQLSTLPLQRSTSAACNVRDSILSDHVSDGLPSQYVREETECRLYYTEHMITDVTAIWKAAADAAFNGKGCACGSLPERVGEASNNMPSSTPTDGITQHVSAKGIEPVKDAAWRARHEHKVIS
ncbi:unnamed protein product [Blumeria hordei]|uniref:Uncharacterized protein n=1 Tax=Blumeria hordei TaxID=2867405 RepID=A0A383UL26_BLUHO|nr:unnamed protein product [Blumeria hordei]